jgi:hypothetical protein
MINVVSKSKFKKILKWLRVRVRVKNIFFQFRLFNHFLFIKRIFNMKETKM